MAELRKDVTKNRWVLVRRSEGGRTEDPSCPFCPGREHETPPETTAYRKDGDTGVGPWEVRVIPDADPYFRVEEELVREGVGMYDKVSPRGASELVIESPEHLTWATMSEEALTRVLWMYRDRILDLKRDPKIRDILVMKRVGKAGVGIQHPYSRVIAIPVIFDDKRVELTQSREYYSYKQRCVYCDILRQEIASGERVLALTPYYLVMLPYAARFPYEAWILPRNHQCAFESATTSEIAEAARLLQRLARCYLGALETASHEIVWHTAPNLQSKILRGEWGTIAADYHWHIEVIPDPERQDRVGGVYVNSVPPEEAVKLLRDAW